MSDELKLLYEEYETLSEQRLRLRIRRSQAYQDRIIEMSQQIDSDIDQIPVVDGKMLVDLILDPQGRVGELSSQLEGIRAQIRVAIDQIKQLNRSCC